SGYQLAIHRSHFRFYSLSKTQAGLPREEAGTGEPKYRFSYGEIHDIRLLSSHRVLVTLRRLRCARDPLSRCVAL
ncbi:MAG: hypothetical protein ACN6QE_23040, partial [Pseudomonas putida]